MFISEISKDLSTWCIILIVIMETIATLFHKFIVCKALSYTLNPLMPAGNKMFSNYYASFGGVSLRAKKQLTGINCNYLLF